jgi:hypothetical protein
LRSRHPPAAEPGVAPVLMHGFLNVFLAAGFVAGAGMDLEAAVATLEDTSPGAFVFTDHEVSRGPYRLDVERLRSLRRTFATGFGSCSFEEPIEGLRAMDLLPD